MKIEIEAEDMLQVLVNNNIEPTDAKAIVYDLIVTASGVERPAKKVPQALRRQAVTEQRPPERPERTEEYTEEAEEVDSHNTTKRPRKVSFAAFGGPAESPR